MQPDLLDLLGMGLRRVRVRRGGRVHLPVTGVPPIASDNGIGGGALYVALHTNGVPFVPGLQTAAGVRREVFTLCTVATSAVACAALPVMPAGGVRLAPGVTRVLPIGRLATATTEARAVPAGAVGMATVGGAVAVAFGVACHCA